MCYVVNIDANKVGPSVDPWGTPLRRGRGSECRPSTLTDFRQLSVGLSSTDGSTESKDQQIELFVDLFVVECSYDVISRRSGLICLHSVTWSSLKV